MVFSFRPHSDAVGGPDVTRGDVTFAGTAASKGYAQ
jgi:hypothetical protein